MPFKSEAQRRKFYAMAAKGKISWKTVRQWEDETPDKKLPAYVRGKQAALAKYAQKLKPAEVLRASQAAYEQATQLAARERARLEALGVKDMHQTGSSGANLLLPSVPIDLDFGIPHDGDPEPLKNLLTQNGFPQSGVYGANTVYSYTTPEGATVDLQVRPRKQVEFIHAGIQRLKNLPEKERRKLLLQKHKLHQSGDKDAYSKWKVDTYARYGVLPPGGDWSKFAATKL